MALMKVIYLICVFLLPLSAHAAWMEPKEVLQGNWGSGDRDFGFRSGEPVDQFPTKIVIFSNSNIIIEDWINKRLIIYASDGTYLKSLNQPGSGIYELTSDSIITFKWDEQVKKRRIGAYSLSQQEWLWVDQYRVFDANVARVVVADTAIIVWDGKQNGYKYSFSGQLLQTYSHKPDEFGEVSRVNLGGGQYNYLLRYPGKTYLIKSSNTYEEFIKCPNENIYGIASVDGGEFPTHQVSKYSSCGKYLGEIRLPNTKYGPQVVDREEYGAFERARTVIEEYGKPVVAPNGDVYTWKRTPDKYSILKWTWVDDPNVPTGPDAPSGLSVTPSINGLYLTWTASPQDPGCVTGYEIARATSSGGVFSTVGTVDKGVVRYNDTTAETGTMYYYKVRAKAGSEYSPYTSEVSGKR